MEKKDLLKIREKLHKSYISLLTNTGYNIPASTRSQAEIKWLDVYVAFNSAFDLHEDEDND
jgi:hypothetical protein